MVEPRRSFLKWMAGGAAWLAAATYGFGALAGSLRQTAPAIPWIGVNTYYLLVEAYRSVVARRGRRLLGTVTSYLKDDLRLFELRDRCRLNTLRFWAFNDYPQPYPQIVPGAFDGRLWNGVNQPDPLAFDVLEALVEALRETEFNLIPVLGNYWVSYGGIIQYLIWAGELPPEAYLLALCTKYHHMEKLYLEQTLRFYTSAEVEECYRSHTAAVLERLAKNPHIAIIDVLNEPRGKTKYSLENRRLQDGRFMSDVVARWLNRQGAWIKRQWAKYSGSTCRISSGEEGWSESPPPGDVQVLKKASQYYEGIDLRKNLTFRPSGLDTGSVHLYTHKTVRKQRPDACGDLYWDQRGWEHLLRSDLPRNRKNYKTLSLEWIVSRSALLTGKPWYIGEMGWSWPRSESDHEPLSAADLQKERIELYRSWTTTALNCGALGTCLWMLNGCQHKDDFYGLTIDQLVEIVGK